MEVNLNGMKLQTNFRQYQNGRLAIELLNECQEKGWEGEMELWTVATVNVPYEHLWDNEVAIKDYKSATFNPNKGVLKALQDAGIVVEPNY